jgi:DNA-binding transcriptional regulator GbsR (MarR family)
MPSEDTYFTKDNQPATEKKNRKGIPNLKTVINSLLEKVVTDGDGDKVTRFIKMVNAQIKKAEKGDTQAFNALSNRMEGQPKQEIDQNIKSNVVRVIRADEE